MRVRFVLVGVSLLAIALVAAVLIGRSTKGSAALDAGLGSGQAVSAIDGTLAAQNHADWKAAAAYWTKDAVMEEPTKGTIWKGREQISGMNEGTYNLGVRMYRAGPVIQVGNIAAYAMRAEREGEGVAKWMDLVEFDENYKIVHLWSGFDAGPTPTG